MGNQYDHVGNLMREAFLEQLSFGAQVIFDALPQGEQDRIIGIKDWNNWEEIEDAISRGVEYDCSITEDQKTEAIRNYYINGGMISSNWYGKTSREYTNWLPLDIVRTYDLFDVVKARGWILKEGEYVSGYYHPAILERLKRQAEQEQADARDLELGRKFGLTLASIQATTQRTEQGVGALVQHLPDAKKPTAIPWEEAVAIMEAKGGNMTERTGRNWIKAGKAAKTGTPISWDDLRTTQSWAAWVDAYLAALRSRATCRKIVSERAAQIEQESRRRRSPNA